MLSREELSPIAVTAMKGRSPQDYVSQGTEVLSQWLAGADNRWKALGPYYGVVRQLLMDYQPEFQQVQQWAEPVDYLSHYDYEDDALNLVAALTYLNREGEYQSHPEQPHSIVLADGSNALFVPGVGILET